MFIKAPKAVWSNMKIDLIIFGFCQHFPKLSSITMKVGRREVSLLLLKDFSSSFPFE